MTNPPLRSPFPELIKDEKLSLPDFDSEDEANPYEDDSVGPTAASTTEPINPLVELRRIDMVISYPIENEKLGDSNEL